VLAAEAELAISIAGSVVENHASADRV